MSRVGDAASVAAWTRWNRARYTVLAPVYDAVVHLLDRPRRRAIERLGLDPGERVLLFGAGTGLDLPFLPPGLRITAIDLTPAMLARLERRAERLGVEVEARVMDGQRLDLPDASFDAVVAHLILAVIPDPLAAAREIARVLVPGGRVSIFDKFVADGGRPSLLRRVANLLARVVATELDRQLGPMLAAAGLELVDRRGAAFGGLFETARAVKPVTARRDRLAPTA